MKDSKDIAYFLFKREMNENMHLLNQYLLKALWFSIK